MDQQNRTIVIGGSAGSLQALTQIIASLQIDQKASVFVALHGSGEKSIHLLEKRLSKASELKVKFGENDEDIKSGTIYVAPPDRHLMIEDGHIRISHGARVNRSRPAIDLLFRSAAVAHSIQTIGVILSGLLSDGTAGLSAVKRCGGITIAQDPRDAEFDDMPRSAIEAVSPDNIAKASEIGPLLNELVQLPVKQNGEIPEEIIIENRLDLNKKMEKSKIDKIGERAPLSCPECGGPMWKINGENTKRYRCHSGHSLNTDSLLDGQSDEIEKTLRVALRTMEEKVTVQEKLIKSGRSEPAGSILQERVTESKSHIDRLRKLILDI